MVAERERGAHAESGNLEPLVAARTVHMGCDVGIVAKEG